MKMNVGPLVISAAHFIHTCVPDSPCQRMHGHNYIVNIEVSGEPDECSCMLVDANIVKKVVDKYDHRTLVAVKCLQSLLEYDNGTNKTAMNVIVNPTTKMTYIIPTNDCLIIDIPSTSAEWLAKAIAKDIISINNNVSAVEVNIAETPKLNITVRESKLADRSAWCKTSTTKIPPGAKVTPLGTTLIPNKVTPGDGTTLKPTGIIPGSTFKLPGSLSFTYHGMKRG